MVDKVILSGVLPTDWACLSVWGASALFPVSPSVPVFGSTGWSSMLTVIPGRLKSWLQETVQGCVHSEVPRSGTAQPTSRGLQTLAFHERNAGPEESRV